MTEPRTDQDQRTGKPSWAELDAMYALIAKQAEQAEQAEAQLAAVDARHAEEIAALTKERDDFYMNYRIQCDVESKASLVRAEKAEAENTTLREQLAAAQQERNDLSALAHAVLKSVRDDEKGEQWTIRKFLSDRGVYNDDIGSSRRLVAEAIKHVIGKSALSSPSTPEPDATCEHGIALDVHCCNCHSGFIFDVSHECPPTPPSIETWRAAIEWALGLEADAENHTPEWAAEAVRAIREIGNVSTPEPQMVCEWRPISTAPKDTALLLWTGWSFQLGHFNTALGEWVCGWDHRPIEATHWMPLPLKPLTLSPEPSTPNEAPTQESRS